MKKTDQKSHSTNAPENLFLSGRFFSIFCSGKNMSPVEQRIFVDLMMNVKRNWSRHFITFLKQFSLGITSNLIWAWKLIYSKLLCNFRTAIFLVFCKILFRVKLRFCDLWSRTKELKREIGTKREEKFLCYELLGRKSLLRCSQKCSNLIRSLLPVLGAASRLPDNSSRKIKFAWSGNFILAC